MTTKLLNNYIRKFILPLYHIQLPRTLQVKINWAKLQLEETQQAFGPDSDTIEMMELAQEFERIDSRPSDTSNTSSEGPEVSPLANSTL